VRAPKTPAEDGGRGFVPGPWCAVRLAAVLAEQVRLVLFRSGSLQAAVHHRHSVSVKRAPVMTIGVPESA